MAMEMNPQLIKIKDDTIININNVTIIRYESGNLLVEFQSSGDVHRITLSGSEAARLWAYMNSVSHDLPLLDK